MTSVGPAPRSEPLAIGINTAIERRGISGTRRTVEVFRAVIEASPELRLREASPSYARRNRVWNLAHQTHWDLFGAARALDEADVLLSPCNVGFSRPRQRSLLVIHDTMVLDRPELFDPGYVRWARALFGRSARRAHHIITPSRFSRERIARHFPGAPEVSVLPWPVDRLPAADRVPRELPEGRLTVITVGATEPHKHHVDALRAVDRLRRETGLDIELSVCGPPGRAEAELHRVAAELDPDRSWITRSLPTDDELHALYRTAWTLFQPSELEGFGLPVAEAQAHGTPVIHSAAGSLPEITPNPSAVPRPVPEGAPGSEERLRGYTAWLRMLLDPAAYHSHSAAAFTATDGLSRATFQRGFEAAVAASVSGATG